MDQSPARDEAVETLRAVEGMRRRTIAATQRMSPLPLVVFGLSMLAAAPFTWLWARGADGDGVASIAMLIPVALATLVSVSVSEWHYRRQPVHPATPKRRTISTGDAIILAAVIIVLGPLFIGLLFSVVSFSSNGTVAVFIVLTLASLIMGKRMRNGALAVAGALGLILMGLSPFIYADHWETVAAGSYAALFLAAALIVRVTKRRTA